ncbi:MAG: hypothetical protein ABW252_15095 [Polyangiales bacterium]
MKIRPEDIPGQVVDLCRTLARHGHRSWVVGGCLRDLLRGQQPADWDLATDARPEAVMKVFPRVIATGLQHGTVTVRKQGASYEITTLRGEGAYSDGRRPDSVHFVTDVREDLSRRDFTVNALAYDPLADALEDPFEGLADLEAGVLRAVGEPARRFGEDGLRVLRAARFAATLEFTIAPDTEAAIGPTLDTFRRVSAERVREEWLKALKARAPSRAFDVMRRTGILAITEPRLAALDDARFAATLRGVDAAPADPIVRLAALLWPLRDDPASAGKWLTAYRFSTAERDRVVRMLAHAAPTPTPASDADVRRYARSVGRAGLDEVTALGARMTRAHEGDDAPAAQDAATLAARVHALVAPDTPLSVRELAVGGRDLMEEVGVPKGPKLGEVLDALLERVLDAPSENTREALLAEARRRLAAEGAVR